MRFTQFLRRLGCGTSARTRHPNYRLTIVGSSTDLQRIKQPLYQNLRTIGASVTRAQSIMLHEDQLSCTSLIIDCTSPKPLVFHQLVSRLGQKEGIRRVQIETH